MNRVSLDRFKPMTRSEEEVADLRDEISRLDQTIRQLYGAARCELGDEVEALEIERETLADRLEELENRILCH